MTLLMTLTFFLINNVDTYTYIFYCSLYSNRLDFKVQNNNYFCFFSISTNSSLILGLALENTIFLSTKHTCKQNKKQTSSENERRCSQQQFLHCSRRNKPPVNKPEEEPPQIHFPAALRPAPRPAPQELPRPENPPQRPLRLRRDRAHHIPLALPRNNQVRRDHRPCHRHGPHLPRQVHLLRPHQSQRRNHRRLCPADSRLNHARPLRRHRLVQRRGSPHEDPARAKNAHAQSDRLPSDQQLRVRDHAVLLSDLLRE